MKFLPLVALLCAMMALSGAAALPEEHEQPATEEPVADVRPEEEEEPVTEEPGERSPVVKMSTFCPCGWTAINGRCFIYVPRNMTWAHAEKHCLSMGGHLASVHSTLDYHAIQMMILSATHCQQEAWLGASDAQQEGYWFWSDGTKFLYSHWCPGEPNNLKKNQHCLQMNHSGAKCWDDLSCTRHRPSVCAKQARKHDDEFLLKTQTLTTEMKTQPSSHHHQSHL